MTATQVINEIKALDPQERAKVLDLLQEIEVAQKNATTTTRPLTT